MTQHNLHRPEGGIGRFHSAFTLQRQYLTLWLKSRLRRTRLPQTFMVLAGVILSAMVLCTIMAAIVIFDIVMLLVSVMQKLFRRRNNLRFPAVRANA
ncbi:hypothetical protein AwEntero_31630 [Enterobacterales bacterium]|nr:hypothetical protein AwEntero_31630 [Enterobacterales bacterium]